jgi:dihydrofolate synthase/folylpolyglutamate synthase
VGYRLSAYRDALDFLFVRTTGQWRLGLDRTRALLAELGNPEQQLRVVHIAGTNGKGSVCATLDAVLQQRGHRVARYTSPHLVDFRERFLIDGVPVDEAAVVQFIEQWTPTVERLGATFFEATTAMAFHLFAAAKPDVAIIEVGLGGRLDSTNVVDPLAAIVTSIGIDHTEFLGDSREAIAGEKAGIFKPGRPAVIGDRDPAIRQLLVEHAAAARAAPIVVAPTVDAVRVTAEGTAFLADGEPFVTPLVGRHQADNTAVALAALEQLPEGLRVARGEAGPLLAAVRLPGRFQRHGRYLFDVAHNRDGAAVCAAGLRAVTPPRPVVAVLSVLGDKDWRGILTELAPVVDRFILTTAPTSPASRAWDPAAVLRVASEMGVPAALERDFDRALDRAAREGETVLITGSFHTVGDAMDRLQVSPLAG